MLANIKNLVARGQVDSMLNYVKNQNTLADTSFQVYGSTNPKGGVLKLVVVDGDSLYIYNMEPFTVVEPYT